MTALTVQAENGESEIFETSVADIQSDVSVEDGKITGTLKYLDEGPIADYWGAGYFLALKFSNVDERATSVKVGMTPSVSSGLVELLGDPDMNGVFKVTNKLTQQFTVITTDGTNSVTQYFDLRDLELD